MNITGGQHLEKSLRSSQSEFEFRFVKRPIWLVWMVCVLGEKLWKGRLEPNCGGHLWKGILWIVRSHSKGFLEDQCDGVPLFKKLLFTTVLTC